jgi:cytochrome b6-f complex iron-sulfur subunit
MAVVIEKENSVGRRSFLNWLWMGLGFVALVEVMWVIGSFLRPRRPVVAKGDFGAVVDAGPVHGFEKGSVTAFPRGRFYLARLGDGGFLAVSRTCTHLGCTVPWDEKDKLFACPCHGSTFDMAGSVLRSPAPRPLDIFRVSIENDTVYVDTAKPIKRREFRQEQVAYAKDI